MISDQSDYPDISHARRGRGRPRNPNPSPAALRSRARYAAKLAGSAPLTNAPRCSYEVPLTCGFKPRAHFGIPSVAQLHEMSRACDRFFASRGILWVSMADQIKAGIAEARA